MAPVAGPHDDAALTTREEGRNHLEAPADLELEALVDRLLAGRFLPAAFEGERQAL